MINNYSYDVNKITPYSDKTFDAAGANKYNYKEIYGKGMTKETTTKDSRNPKFKSKIANIFEVTMGLSHHFTLNIDNIAVDNSVKTVTYGKFLPIKSIAYKPVSIESTRINFGVLADFPLVHKRKMGSIQVTLLDTADNAYELATYRWFASSVDTATGYVSPMDEIISQAQYTEYTNDGKLSKLYTFDVIPDGEVSLNRNYENPSLKEIAFNIIIVSPIAVQTYPAMVDETVQAKIVSID